MVQDDSGKYLYRYGAFALWELEDICQWVLDIASRPSCLSRTGMSRQVRSVLLLYLQCPIYAPRLWGQTEGLSQALGQIQKIIPQAIALNHETIYEMIYFSPNRLSLLHMLPKYSHQPSCSRKYGVRLGSPKIVQRTAGQHLAREQGKKLEAGADSAEAVGMAGKRITRGFCGDKWWVIRKWGWTWRGTNIKLPSTRWLEGAAGGDREGCLVSRITEARDADTVGLDEKAMGVSQGDRTARTWRLPAVDLPVFETGLVGIQSSILMLMLLSHPLVYKASAE